MEIHANPGCLTAAPICMNGLIEEEESLGASVILSPPSPQMPLAESLERDSVLLIPLTSPPSLSASVV